MALKFYHQQKKHKYLGREFSGEVRTRGKVAVEHRLSFGWMKYKAFQAHLYEASFEII